jgi:phospholipid/cholesterol/gamma-HCH transport system substrate-binding protein
VTVGYVDAVELQQNGVLITTFRITDDYKVPLGSRATVVPNGIFGDMAVALTPERPNPQSFNPGDTVPVGPTTPGIAQITAKADSIARSVNTVTTALQQEMVAAGGLREMRQAIAGTNRLIAEFSSIADEQSRQLSATMTSLRRTMAALDPAKVDSTMTNVRTASANMAAMSADLKETSAKLDLILAKVDSGPGSAAMLLNDPGIYNDARGVLARIDSLVADVKRNPKRYINVSVF